ncbi:MAG: response regulator transcription factor [Armatimonadota bacterium]|nr:response regulator transcription factor [Armatimonadota bacterium]MDR7492738.1 response regulator transcription factor [Armatimonadota bacterium]MDR7498514.1 response regulator transcription factor [Armatimonadota bacterium]MDR7552697.1 response regulator transcription factor [Armatimonadota bacterium]MDR7557867.1 response regulator transcription factor [Armatimonadota bacterium]
MPKVLIVDDEESIVDLLRSYLTNEGFRVEAAMDGPTALAKARAFRPDVVVLDIMLPGLDGIEVLRQLRAESPVYVIMLTAKADEADKVVGLSVGADDYVTKPFSPRELTARLRAILRRGRGAAPEPPRVLMFRQLRLDPARREVWKDDEPVELTTLEFNLLHTLASYPGHVLSREQLLERVWGTDYFGDDRVVDAHIKKLRQKLGDDAAEPRFIQTVRGIGYKFVAEPL